MITNEDILRIVEEEVSITEEDLAKKLNCSEKDLKAYIKEMTADRTLWYSKKGRLTLGATLGFFKGELEVKQRGFAFLRTPEDKDDIFINSKDKNGAMNGEIVLVKLKSEQKGEKPEGEVVAILSKHSIKVVGTVKCVEDKYYVISDEDKSSEIFIPKDCALGAQDGQKVVVKLTERQANIENEDRENTGKIIEILGMEGETGVDILSFARRFGLDAKFNDACIKEAKALQAEKPDYTGRLDLRSEIIFTIDGDDAKDLDDAVSLKRLDNGNWKLGVHIADVSNYVTEGSKLNKEAFNRGTSVYLVDRVIPMLPKELSNDLCSLNAGTDKLTLSCIMELDNDGNVVNYEVANTVINSNYRMTYNNVNKILDGDAELCEKYSDVVVILNDMNKLAKKLRKKRFEKGSLDFDLPEPEIKVGKKGIPYEITVRERGDAEKLIEEFMLKCNITVAEHMYHMDLPFIYRVHEQPDAEKIKELSIFLTNFGIKLRQRDKIYPKELQDVLKKADGTPYANIVNEVTLRSLKKAFYDILPEGHFGLAADQYTHFTSPIRRYPDLLAHRIIKMQIAGKLNEEVCDYLEKEIPPIASQCSERERNAIEAERAVDDLKMAEYMQGNIGKKYDGVISGVTSFGIFVELENTVEGMIPLAQMDDYYEFSEKDFCVIGARTKKKYTLGDKIKIIVEDVNIDAGQIEFKFPKEKELKKDKKTKYVRNIKNIKGAKNAKRKGAGAKQKSRS